MKIPFACPSCGAAGSADLSYAGKAVRCKHCNHRFILPGSGEPEPEDYALAEPTEGMAGCIATGPAHGSAFVPARGDEPSSVTAPRARKRTGSASRGPIVSRQEPVVAWRAWLLRAGVFAAVVIAATALVAPRGTVIAGCVLMALGSGMVLAGYAVGAYAAFREDFLYGFLYLAVPLYTAYYLVSRWEDLWVWFACSSAGVVLVLLGTEMLRWSGIVV